MTKLKITVTKEIIKKSKWCGTGFELEAGVELISQSCAIALAVRDVFPNASVGSEKMVFNLEGYDTCIDLPQIAQNFIRDFDMSIPEMREKMKPISFEIEIPDSVINQINIDELKSLLTNHPTLELVEQS